MVRTNQDLLSDETGPVDDSSHIDNVDKILFLFFSSPLYKIFLVKSIFYLPIIADSQLYICSVKSSNGKTNSFSQILIKASRTLRSASPAPCDGWIRFIPHLYVGLFKLKQATSKFSLLRRRGM